jgi:hypothetical protein
VERDPATLVPGLQPWNALPGGSSLLVHAFNTLARQEKVHLFAVDTTNVAGRINHEFHSLCYWRLVSI